MTVKELADSLCLWTGIEGAVRLRCGDLQGDCLLDRLGALPVRRSHATSRLGSYVFKGAAPICIRLQFAQEADCLRLTFLHEVAHACDHLCRKGNHRRHPHGASWRLWAQSLGIDASLHGESQILADLHRSRRKLVAICRLCGAEIYRVRYLNRRGSYMHPVCGGVLTAVRDRR